MKFACWAPSCEKIVDGINVTSFDTMEELLNHYAEYHPEKRDKEGRQFFF